MASWLNQLKAPSATYRGAPFWAWNAKLDPRELVRQVGEFQRAGLGGFFMHVRYGLETEYLSGEFMACVKAVVAEAKKRRMEAWLYDEDRWPSGFGGGIVTAKPEHRIKALQWEAIPAEKFTAPPADALRCFTARLEGASAFDVRPLAAGEKPGAGRSVLVYRVLTSGGVAWYNHTANVDSMNPDAVKAFLDCTHEVYKQAVGKEFGRTVPGIFTDEPNYGHFSIGGEAEIRSLPWTARFPDEFRRRAGYDLLDRLVEVSHRVGGAEASSVRRDYYRVATELYVEAYSQQIGEWCARNHLESTGHELSEESLPSQIWQVGACMPHYEWFQRPGIDILCDRFPQLLTAKQAVSVASQLGRNRVLSELYGCTGWDATFEMYKHIGDWHQVLGINHFCPHLSWYSMAGGAKRDYPAGIFYQSPWWSDHRLLGDYFGRLSLALSQGQAVREVAVIHPIETGWATYVKGQSSLVAGYSQALERLCEILLDNQLDFDFADESLLAKYGSVTAPGGVARLQIGKMSYRAVIVPESLTLRSTTLEALEKFADRGGRIVFVGRQPELVDAKPSDRAVRLARRSTCLPLGASAVLAALGNDCRPAAVQTIMAHTGPQDPRTWIHFRRTDAGEVLFACNLDRARSNRVRIRWLGSGRIREIDPRTGGLSDVPGVESKEGRDHFTADLPPTGSRLYLRTAEPAVARAVPAAPVETLRVRLAPEWDYRLDEPNGLALDYARLRVLGTNDGSKVSQPGQWRARKLLWQHEADLRKELGFPDNTEPKEQPYIWLKNLSPRSATVEVEFEVNVEHPPVGPVSLALEHPEHFEISANGKAVAGRPKGWFIDRSFEVVPLTGVRFAKGVNVLRLRTEYRQHHWLEECYLLGKFGVRVTADRALVTALPKKLAVGDWVAQGLAMYSGAVAYRQTVRVGRLARGQRAVLCIDRPKATVLRMTVNGKKMGTVGWAPWRVDVTRALKPGAANRIEITVVSSRRNLLGPLHYIWKNPTWTGPYEFRPRPEHLIPDYNLVAYGLLGEAYLAIEA